jgi:adenylate kinase family enzyme
MHRQISTKLVTGQLEDVGEQSENDEKEKLEQEIREFVQQSQITVDYLESQRNLKMVQV